MNHGIGNKILYLRKQKNITQTELAQYLYVTPQTVSKWESGNGIPDISLIPKIATIFDVSLDYLFDMTDTQRVKDMILKYSVLKDDHSFEAASSMVERMLCDTGLDDSQKAEIYALKGHLYLQKARDALSKALEATNQAATLSQDLDKTPLIMQAYLLRLMNGEYRSVKGEAKTAFLDNPDYDSLYIYLEVLMVLNNYEEIIEIVEKDEATKIIIADKTSAVKIWEQYLQALAYTDSLKKAKDLYDELASTARDSDLLNLSMLMAKRYSENGDPNLEEMKRKAFSLLNKLDYNDYIKKEIEDKIRNIQ